MDSNSQVICYSKYGYLKVSSSDFQTKDIMPFTSVNGSLKGSINKSSLLTNISLLVKSISGKRRTFTFTVSPNEVLKKLILLYLDEDTKADKEEKKSIKSCQPRTYRIITTNGIIKELHLNKKIYEENLQNNQLLLLTPILPIKFSNELRGNQIVLENNYTTINKIYGDDAQLAFVDKSYNNKTLYTEFILDTEPDDRNIIIGVCPKTDDFYFEDCLNFWGYILSDAKKIIGSETYNYGKVCKCGDTVGVLLQFKKIDQGPVVSFFVNGENQGVAFDAMPPNVYYPAVSVYYEGTMIRVIENSLIPEGYI